MNLEKTIKSMGHVAPDIKQIERIEKVRAIYKDVANTIYRYCPNSDELDEADKLLLDSLMWAVKSIVMEEEKNKND